MSGRSAAPVPPPPEGPTVAGLLWRRLFRLLIVSEIFLVLSLIIWKLLQSKLLR